MRRGRALIVADDGPGIPAAEQERIFERFYRAPAPADGPAGSGLGLADCPRAGRAARRPPVGGERAWPWQHVHGNSAAGTDCTTGLSCAPVAGVSASGAQLVSAEQAVQHIQSGQRVFLHGAAATPHVLARTRWSRARPSCEDVEVVHLHAKGRRLTSRQRWPATCGTARCSSAPTLARRSTMAARTSCRSSCLTSQPVHRRPLPLDVALINVSPPDAPRLLLARDLGRRGHGRGRARPTW